MSVTDRLEQVFTARADGRRLALVRLIIGAAAVAKAPLAQNTIHKVLDPEHLRVPFFDWLPTLPAEAVPFLVGLWMLAAGCFALGCLTPLAGALLMGVLGYVLALDQQLYSNHLYLLLVLVFLLTLGQAGRCLSIDALRRGRPNLTAEALNPTVPGWPVLLLRWQLTIVYAFAGLSKINGEYLSGAVLRAELHTGWINLPDAWLNSPLAPAMAAGSILAELFLAAAFWVPRLRRPAAVAGLGFHLSLMLMMPGHVAAELGVFAITLCALYLLFFEPEPETAAKRQPANPLPKTIAAG